MSGQSPDEGSTTDLPPHRYDANLAADIESRWQQFWDDNGTFHAPNPTGPLSDGFDGVADAERLFVMDMFPYPSGAGLHVGHPLGFIGTDVFARYKRMDGYNVLHTMGFDAFGLPAEQYAVQTGRHPRATTEANIETYRRQLRRLGLGHDPRRSVATTDVSYVRWTQWIFLQLFNSWFDETDQRARPISELVAEFASGVRPTPDTPWADLDDRGRRTLVDDHRLAYVGEAMVNWCPGLGTVLANEEVTIDGRSDRGNFPVYKRPLRQWMMRITAYNERLLTGLADLDWPEPIKLMQRNWIGRSTGAEVDFQVVGSDETITVFTTRPDTLFGATYMVLAPENPLVDKIAGAAWPTGTDSGWTGGAASPADAIAAYRSAAAQKSDIQRQADSKEKTGVFIGASATNPITGAPIPIFIADYVLMGYGTGAIMAVPAEDERDWDFATAFNLSIVRTVQPPDDWDENGGGAFTGDGVAVNSGFLDGLAMAEAKAAMIDHLQAEGTGRGTTTYKLRDWLFSRQRYWGEPFPIVWDGDDMPVALPESELPVLLPEIDDYAPRALGENDDPEPPLGRASDWVDVDLDIGDGSQRYRRELNTMPQWAGSCWYYLRYLDPTNESTFCDPELEDYWLSPKSDGAPGGVDLYVGGVEHAVLHLLYARFWHMVLFDLGHVQSREPFQKLFNQGYIQAAAYLDERGQHVEAEEVEERNGSWFHDDKPVTRQIGKMGKSLKNSVAPDDMCDRYGADAFRMYEMFTGPLDQSRPWETKDVVGVYRVLQRVWRLFVDEDSGELRVDDSTPDDETLRVLHRTIAAVRDGMEDLRFNVSIAKLTELTNHLTGRADATTPRAVAEPLALMLAPLAPHLAEELWQRLGHEQTVAWQSFPVADDGLLVDETVEIVVQVKGKVRAKLQMAADADPAAMEAAARADARIAELLDGVEVRKVIPVPGKLINFVTA